MGSALCRFSEDGCQETGSQHYYVNLPNAKLNVPSLWKHYMTEHLIQPTDLEREVIMAANPDQATGRRVITKSVEEIKILYVEKTDTGYTHQIGTEPDIQFIEQLEKILDGIEPRRTRGL